MAAHPHFTIKATQASAVKCNTVRKLLHTHQFDPKAEEMPQFN